ncbi:M20/M25/M40 family metallo-hydrolase [Vaginisenegalia massiliensis]|uniref:M20/M25/M40 family metallo-hydrolase n=1 Tax=Vaginisenegalia massiliensis TaxID=2058294 RepID=UPI000F5342BF|nr:M20/M25/M40 family metallo-hydrolase [Vaginisenegalia massiliensis]
MKEERLLTILEELLLIHSPSGRELAVIQYIERFLTGLGAQIYLDHNEDQYGGNAPVLFAKIRGNRPGQPVTLNAHPDVIEPNQGLKIVKEGSIWKSDGTTTLGGDDKAGIAAILATVEYLLQSDTATYPDIYIIITPGEENNMDGVQHINWEQVYQVMDPAKDMIVVDNAGKADKVAYQAPTAYSWEITIHGKKAHAGIEPEKGINAIQVASKIISQLPMLRVDQSTTVNVARMIAESPNNVVPDLCRFAGEIRGRNDHAVKQMLATFQEVIRDNVTSEDGYDFYFECDYPALENKDDLALAKQMIAIYQQLGVQAQAQIIGGGSDANYFAEEGFNAIIVGVGMHEVHTCQEYLEIDQLILTTQALIQFIQVR